MKVAVIGGSGEFGRIFARLFREDGCKVTITGRDVEKGKKVADEIGVSFTNDNVKAASESDVVIISVYIENTVDVIKEVAGHVRQGCLLMDVTSVKVEPCRAMKKFAGSGVEIIGTHPMFGPRVTSLEGQVVIVTPVRAKKWEKFLMEFFERHRAKVFTATPEEHDSVMSVVQGLMHFAHIATAATLKELNADVKHSRNFASPIYELTLDIISRIVGQNPKLYASIQMHNPAVRKVHRTFMKQAQTLSSAVAKKDVKSFTRIMTESAKHMGDIESAMGRSDKAILVLTEELKKLGKSIGKEVALKHIYSGVIHIGIVKKIDAEKVVLLTRLGKSISLKLSNVELIEGDFLREWKLKNLPVVRRDFSFVFPDCVDESILKNVIASSDSRIASCSVIDTYRGGKIPEDKKSITFAVEAFAFSEKDFENIKKLIVGIGGVLR